MRYRLEITRRAKQDRDECFDWIASRSPAGARRWLDAFEAAAQPLLTEPHYGKAPESEDHDEIIHQKFFKTPHGRTYRILYVIRDDVIYLIHLRGAGQDVMTPDEVELPDAYDRRLRRPEPHAPFSGLLQRAMADCAPEILDMLLDIRSARGYVHQPIRESVGCRDDPSIPRSLDPSIPRSLDPSIPRSLDPGRKGS
jgi:plasmid stabilization system protein ParE